MSHPSKLAYTDAPSGKPASSAVSNARRRFMQSTASAAGAGCLMALGVGLYASQSRALPASAIRPPGALPEADFLSACVRCGLCVRACPFDTLVLAEPGDNVATGTPYFTAREIPCEMCDDIPCVAYCPTGALERSLEDIDDARMGLAVLIDQENCLNFLGLRCDVCYRVCPLIDKAITLETQHNPRSDRHAMLLPTVHSDACTGCGKCEKACVLPGESAIKVLPLRLAQGSAAPYYLRGWEEKSAAGGESLIGEQVELPVRGLEPSHSAPPPTAPSSGHSPATPEAINPPATRPPVTPRGKEPLFQPFSGPGLDPEWKP